MLSYLQMNLMSASRKPGRPDHSGTLSTGGGAADHEFLDGYQNEARKWVRVGGGLRRQKRSVRSVLTKTELRYVYVHENAPGRGFHSHVLMNVPPVLRKEFDAWSRSCLVRLVGRNISRDAYRFVRSYGKTRYDEIRNAWR
jgi:hypothetical protein